MKKTSNVSGDRLFLEGGETSIEIIRKRIKNMYLRIYPPDGRVVLTAPAQMQEQEIEKWVESRSAWIDKTQLKIVNQQRQQQLDEMGRPLHLYLFGTHQTIRFQEEKSRNRGVQMVWHTDENIIQIKHPPPSNIPNKSIDWSREMAKFLSRELEPIALAMIQKWEQIMGVKSGNLHLRRMKSRWGTCKPSTGKITLNTALAQAPNALIEYVIVHELTHLFEPSHNHRFKSLMTRYLPDWKERKKELNKSVHPF